MTTSSQKGKHVRLYILEDDELPLEKLAQATRLTQTAILTILVSAGLKACVEAGNRLPLPLKFEITEGDPQMNEPNPKYKIRK